MPVGREQQRAEHDTVVRVELAPDRGDQLLARAPRVLLAPDCHGGASPGQLPGIVLAEPHSARFLGTGIAA